MSPTFTVEEKTLMEGLCNAMLSILTKLYELRMIDFLIDSKKSFWHDACGFSKLEGQGSAEMTTTPSISHVKTA